MSVGEAFKRALFSEIEDEFDVVATDEAYEENKKDPETYSMDEIKEMFDL